MNNKLKKIVATVTMVACAGLLAPASGGVQAVTADELLEQIQALQTQLNTLMSQY